MPAGLDSWPVSDRKPQRIKNYGKRRNLWTTIYFRGPYSTNYLKLKKPATVKTTRENRTLRSSIFEYLAQHEIEPGDPTAALRPAVPGRSPWLHAADALFGMGPRHPLHQDAARDFIQTLFSSDTTYIFSHRTEPGAFMLRNNLLRNRSGFRDTPECKSSIYRGRYFDETRALGAAP